MPENYTKVAATIYHYDDWVTTTTPSELKSVFEEMLLLSEFNIVNFTEHYFPVNGYTCIWLLAESHLAIHTFPHENKSYIQLSSCNNPKKDFFRNLVTAYKQKKTS